MKKLALNQNQIKQLHYFFSKYLLAGEVIVFGSRAKGTNKISSDVDIVLKGANPNSARNLEMIRLEINESDFPYLCTIQALETITNPSLLKHIKKMGQTIFVITKKSERVL